MTDTNKARIYYISDISGTSSNNNLILNTSGSDTILGDTQYLININYTSLIIVSNKIDKWILI